MYTKFWVTGYIANLCVKLLLDLCYAPVPSLAHCSLGFFSNQKKTGEEQEYTKLVVSLPNAGCGASHVAMVHNC